LDTTGQGQRPGAQSLMPIALASSIVILRRAEPDEGSLITARHMEAGILRFAQDDKGENGGSDPGILRFAQDDNWLQWMRASALAPRA